MNEIRMTPIKSVHPYPNNPRINGEAIDKVMASLQSFGFRQPIVVDKDYVIVAGHTRLEAAKRLRMKEVPVLVADDLTEEQVKAYRLADNKSAEFSLWDMDKLGDELADILDIDMERFGFDLSEFEEPPQVVEDDYDPNPPEEPNAKRGDVYQLGRHRLMCGDASMIDDVGKLVDGAEMDMLLTDPPYNVDFEEKEKSLLKTKRNSRITDGKLVGIANDSMDDEEFREFLTTVFSNARMVMKDGAAFHVWYAEAQSYGFRGALQDARLKTRQTLIWVKNKFSLSRSDFQRMYEVVMTGDTLMDEEMIEKGYEPCIYGWKDSSGVAWYKKRKEKDVLYFDMPRKNEAHPNMKPILLFDYEMQCNTKKDDLVLDLFAGSGTTLMAAEQNGRTAYCMEIDPRYVDVIIDRWEKFTGKKAELLKE